MDRGPWIVDREPWIMDGRRQWRSLFNICPHGAKTIEIVWFFGSMVQKPCVFIVPTRRPHDAHTMPARRPHDAHCKNTVKVDFCVIKNKNYFPSFF